MIKETDKLTTIGNTDNLINCQYIVSVNPIRKVNEINIKNNYPYIQIGSLEIYGGSEYGNL